MEVIIGLIAALVGVAVGYVVGRTMLLNQQRTSGQSLLAQAEVEGKSIVENARSEANTIVENADDKAKARLNEADESISRRRKELDREEEGLQRRRNALDKRAEDIDNRLERLENREQQLNKRQSRLDKKENELAQREEEKLAELQRIGQMTIDEAREQLLVAAEADARNDMARIIRQVEAEAREEADTRARNIISLAVQRLASEHVSEIAVAVVPLPNDDMKGRIIGRNGRNIRSFEIATGVDVVVDDTPEAVTISSFDPVRREVAKQTMAKLVTDGRIHPARIEKLVDETRQEIAQVIREEGERAAYVTGVHGLHPEIIKLLGQLKFRTSYGQNQHAHAIETANLAGMIAAELGANVDIAKAGGLLHDIGKAIDHEVEGTHAIIGAEFIKRYGVNP
jgi:ribonuclease Y